MLRRCLLYTSRDDGIERRAGGRTLWREGSERGDRDHDEKKSERRGRRMNIEKDVYKRQGYVDPSEPKTVEGPFGDHKYLSLIHI